MKFLCGNCGSKYQISDDKVNGRVLRMKCRKCSNDIVIDGQHPTGPSVRPASSAAATATGASSQAIPRAPAAPGNPVATRPTGPAMQAQTRPSNTVTGGTRPQQPAPSRPATGTASRTGVPAPGTAPPRGQTPAPRAASAPAGTAGLSAGFRRQVASSRPAAPSNTAARNAALDQWHVAVNNVPVGPVGRAEVLRKMNAGAVNEDTLCWREGFDDWRPVREVPELAALLRQMSPARSAPPPIAKSAPPARAQSTTPRQQVGSRPMPHPHRAGDALRQSTAARSNVVPIGGRLGGSAAPAEELAPMDGLPAELPQDDFFGLPESDATVASAQSAAAAQSMMQAQPAAPAAAPVAPEAAVAPQAAPQASMPPAGYAPRRQLSVGAMFFIFTGGMFGAVMAFMLGYKLMFAESNKPQTVEVAKAVPDLAPGEKPIEGTVTRPPDQVVKAAVAEQNKQAAIKRKKAAAAAEAKPADDGKPALSDADKAKLAAMGGSSSTDFSKFAGGNVKLRDSDSGGGKGGGSLNADQLRSVIAAGKPGLTQCYERVSRASGQAQAARVDVSVTIGGSGVVTKVSTSGDDGNGLGTCISGLVKRWRFPAVGGETATQFPLVFQGN